MIVEIVITAEIKKNLVDPVKRRKDVSKEFLLGNLMGYVLCFYFISFFFTMKTFFG